VKEDTDEYHIVSSHMFQMAELVTSRDYKHLKLQMSKKKIYSSFSLLFFKKKKDVYHLNSLFKKK